MDFVDMKKLVRMYRLTYVDLFSYVVFIMQGALQSYSRYRSMSREGLEEWKVTRQYGIFLYHFAELQNLTSDYITKQEDSDYYDWTLVENAVTILRNYETNSIDDTEMMNCIANWSRKWYGFVMTQAHFDAGMQDFRIHIKEIWHDKHGI